MIDMANGNSKILTEEQELKLRKPIEDHVGKIQEKIDSLRVDGTEKVVHLQGIIDRMKKTEALQKGKREPDSRGKTGAGESKSC